MKNDYEKFTFKQKMWMLAAAFAVICAAALAFILIHYRVTEVEVIGNDHYSEEDIRNMVLQDNVTDNSILLSWKYRNKSIKNIPFIESMDVEVLDNSRIRIMVYEKTLAGCVNYLGNYMYFDREGIVVESAAESTRGVPEITGLHFDSVRLYEKLPVEEESIFKEILNLTQLLDKYEIVADKIYFDSTMNVTLYFGQARVRLGGNEKIDEKIMQLGAMVSSIEGKSGVLDMTDFNENTKRLTFEPD